MLLHASATGPGAFAALARQLAHGGRRIVAPAFHGYGSKGLDQPAIADIVARNGDVAGAALGQARGTCRIVFGHSMGGLIALLTALDCAQRGNPLDALILYEPILHDLLDPAVPACAAARSWDREIILRLTEDVAKGEPERGVQGFIEAWNETSWNELPRAVRSQLVANAEILVQETNAMPEQGLTPSLLSALATPVLLIRGDKSPEFTQLVTAQALRAIPGAAETVLTGCGHMAPLNAPDRVAASIEDFLAGI